MRSSSTEKARFHFLGILTNFLIQLLYSHNHYTYTYADACRIITTTQRRATQFFKEYTSHFIWKGSKGLLKVLLCERWVGGWTELQYIDPYSYGHNRVSFPFSWAAQPGAWGSASLGDGSLYRILSPTLTSCLHPGYIIVRHPLSSCGRHKSHSIQPVHGQGYILIFLDGMHRYLPWCISYFDSLAGVNMLHNSYHTDPVEFWIWIWHINYCRLFNAKSIFIIMNSSISNNSV